MYTKYQFYKMVQEVFDKGMHPDTPEMKMFEKLKPMAVWVMGPHERYVIFCFCDLNATMLIVDNTGTRSISGAWGHEFNSDCAEFLVEYNEQCYKAKEA